MMKLDFLEELRRHLSPLKKTERETFISYYEEMIEDYLEDGLSEEEVFEQIGEPRKVAQQILKEQDTVVLKVPSSSSKVLNVLLLVLGFPLWGSLLLAAGALLFSGYLIIWCLPFTTIVMTFAFFVAGLASLIGMPFMMADVLIVGIVQLGMGILSIGLAILCGLATYYSTKKMILITKNSWAKIFQLFRRKVVEL